MSGLGPARLTRFWRFLRRVAEFLVLVLFRWRVSVEGLEHVPRDRGAVLVYNHHSYVDFVMVGWDVVRRLGRPARFLAKSEIWRHPVGRWILDNARAVPVERGSSAGRTGALTAAIEALQAGDLVVVAPEQTISRSFDPLPMKSGAVRMARAAGVEIIPVAGWGTHRFVTKGHGPHWAPRIPVVVRYGAPMAVDPDEDVHAATGRLQRRLADLVDEAQRSYPDGTPAGAWWVPARLGGGAPPHADVLALHDRRNAGWHGPTLHPSPAPRPTLRFRVIAWLVIAVVWLFRGRLRTTGLEHVPRTGGAVIAWNHHSHVDFVVTVYDIYRRLGRPVRFLAKRELWDHPGLGWVPRFADAIPVARADDGDRDRALGSAAAALRAGHLVMVAPEGGINEAFELGSFRTGAARMAQLAEVPLVPSVSWGSQRVSTTGHPLSWHRLRRLSIEVAFGPPLRPRPEEDPVEVTRRLREVMRAMLHAVQERYPDGTPTGAWWVPARLGGGAPSPDPDRPAVRRRPGDAA